MDVLLIVHDNYQNDNQFPLYYGYIASVMRHNGHYVKILNADLFHTSNDELAWYLLSTEWDVIGVSFLAARFKETILDLCDVINRFKKDAWLVLGGHASSASPEYMLKTLNADAVVVGEGEKSMLDLLHDKKVGHNKKVYYNKPIHDLDGLLFPAWDLFPIDEYATCIMLDKMEKNDRIMQMISARGCINSCTFCHRLEKGIRLRSVKNVVDEIEELHERFRVNVIQFQDEMFLISKKRLRAFVNELKKRKLDIKYTMSARVDIFDKEIADLLDSSGCIFVNVGFESSSDDVLCEMKKHATVEKNINTLEILKKTDMNYGLNFIWGFSKDNYNTLMRNVQIIKKYNHYNQLRTIRPVTAYPGSELFDIALQRGLVNDVHDFYQRFENSDLITINFTKYPVNFCYDWLFKANMLLIEDFAKHNDEYSWDDANNLINQFKDLYNGNIKTFRGARHYERKNN